MKKKVLLTLFGIVLLTAFSKSNEVVPFLRSVAKGLPESTNIPVLLPTYWKEQMKKPRKHTAVKVKSYENGFVIYFLSMDKPFLANDPALFHPRYMSNSKKNLPIIISPMFLIL